MRALGLFAIVLLLASLSLARHPPLGSLAGITDEYFPLGAKVRVNGTLGLTADEPSALRPPGYPAFIATVLWAFVDSPARLPWAAFDRQGRMAVQIAQAFVLATVAVLFYLWMSSRLRDGIAWCAALVLAGNPFSIVLVGLLHYDLVHWLFLVPACWATDAALRRERADWALAGAGALWGLSNLARPVTQLLPAFLLAAVWLVGRRRFAQALRSAFALALGMAVVLAPWTARNYRLTGRVVPVADNPWSALWAQSARPLAPDPTRYVWFDLYRDMMPVFTRVTGLPAWDYAVQVRMNNEIEAEYRRVAMRQLSEQPGVFVRNVLATFWSYNVHSGAVLLSAQERLRSLAARGEPAAVRQEWFVRGDAQGLAMSPLAWSFWGLHAAVSLLALWGAARGVIARDTLVAVLLAVHACIGVTHALLFLHVLHYYVKLPLLVAAAFFAVDRLGSPGARAAAAASLALTAFALTTWMLCRP